MTKWWNVPLLGKAMTDYINKIYKRQIMYAVSSNCKLIEVYIRIYIATTY